MTRIKINPNPQVDIVEVRTVWDETTANQLLATKKWKLLHGGCAHADYLGLQAKPVWILGRLE